MAAWNPVPGGVHLAVKVQPKAGRTGVGPMVMTEDGPRLRIAVSDPPEDGKATEAAGRALAHSLRLAASAVTLVRGATSRQKTFHIAGDAPALIARLEKL